MRFKKIAIYVEGRTEQLVLNHFIKIWWEYSGIKIKNIKILSGNEDRCTVVDFDSENPEVEFIIIDVAGEGSLISAISARAKKQQEQNYKILGLRDLFAQDFEKLPPNIDRQNHIYTKLNKAIKIMNKELKKDIYIFFSVMEIEAWLLVFPHAIANWVNIPEKEVLDIIENKANSSMNSFIEAIKRPSVVLGSIGKLGGCDNAKSQGSITNILNKISRQSLTEMYSSNKLPNFNKFWDQVLE